MNRQIRRWERQEIARGAARKLKQVNTNLIRRNIINSTYELENTLSARVRDATRPDVLRDELKAAIAKLIREESGLVQLQIVGLVHEQLHKSLFAKALGRANVLDAIADHIKDNPDWVNDVVLKLFAGAVGKLTHETVTAFLRAEMNRIGALLQVNGSTFPSSFGVGGNPAVKP